MRVASGLAACALVAGLIVAGGQAALAAPNAVPSASSARPGCTLRQPVPLGGVGWCQDASPPR